MARLRFWSALALAIVALGGMGCTKSEKTLTAQEPLVLDAAGETLRLDEAKVPVVANCSSGQIVQKMGSGWTCSTPGPGGVPVTWDTVTDKPGSFPPAMHSHPWNEVVGAPDFALSTSVAAVASQVSSIEGNLTTAQGKLTQVEGRVAALEGSSGVSSPLMMSARSDDSALIGAGYSMVGLGRPENFTARASLPSVHSHVINAAVLGTKVYVAGGYIAANQFTSNLREYDLVTDKWTARQQMANARYGHVLVGARGKVYAIGGATTVAVTATEIYDPQLNTWSLGAPLPDHNHYAAASGILSDGKLHVVGGYDHITNRLSTSHVVYDFDTNTWSTARELPVARSWQASGVLPDGKLIVAGGYDGSNPRAETYIFDPATNSWNQAASMPTAMYIHSGAVIAGKFHTFLGYSGGILNSHYIYDPASNTWSTGAPVPYSMYASSVAQLRGGALLIGGWASSNAATTTVYEYLAPLHLYAK